MPRAANCISVDEYHAYREAFTGFCTSCQDWTTGCVEPDARHYECESCGEREVFGVEEAFMLELIELEED